MSTTVPSLNTGSSKRPPARPGHFLWGVLPEYRRGPLAQFTKAAREQGDFVHLRFGPNSVYFLNHPAYIQHVLQQNHRNYRRQRFGNNIVKTVIGLNLLTGDGDLWLKQRRLIQPAFHRQRIAGFGQIMTEAALKHFEGWDRAATTGQWLNIHQEMMHITLEVVGKALFSVDLSAETSMLGQNFKVSLDYINYRLKRFFYTPLFIPTPRNRALKRAIKSINHLLQSMIDERRRTGEHKDDLMAMLLEARDEETGEGMSDQQLRNELATMIGAGHETTALALTWTFYLLSQHPDVEAKLLDELALVLGGRPPAVDDLPQLNYTRMVIEESMRLYPPAWSLVAREPIEADEIAGYPIPVKSSLIIVPYVTHRDPRFWDRADQFEPERFLPERAAERHRFAYIPFGNGPRKCIGYSFALTEAQLILATIIQHYQLTLKPGYPVEPDPIFTLRVKGGALPMAVTKR